MGVGGKDVAKYSSLHTDMAISEGGGGGIIMT